MNSSIETLISFHTEHLQKTSRKKNVEDPVTPNLVRSGQTLRH